LSAAHLAATAAPPGAAPPPPVFGLRLACGLFGVLLAAMTAGLNNRVGSLGLADLRGALGTGVDEASWLNSAYLAGELVAMPFATWMSITFSMRRFQLCTLAGALLIALLLPEVSQLPLLIALRGMQGFLWGCQIPLLMMGALRFLPPPIRLHGLALYAMTATFSPNVALWLSALWLDVLQDWRWVYWEAIPLGLLAMLLVGWGIPAMPPALSRLKSANWPGLLAGTAGLTLLALGLDQGARLDWFRSPLIITLLWAGGTLSLVFLVSEWLHPAPFIKLQLLERRNLGLGFALFFSLLIVMLSGASLPANNLGHVHGFRVLQLQPIGLMIGLPQLILGPLVALLLYQRWVDARYLFIAGLILIATACWLASSLSSEWMSREFMLPQILQALGQPLAVIPLLFLGTSVVAPMEGPYVSGIINTLRGFGMLFGNALLGHFMTLRTDFHSEMLLDHAANALTHIPTLPPPGWLSAHIAEQAGVLASADAFRLLGVVALALIPGALCLQFIPAPMMRPVTPPATPHTTKP
jgi:DHA2 family multidrug resistance protein